MVAALANTSPTLNLGCSKCGAALVIEADQRATICPYCDAPTIVERPVSADRPVPTFVVGFVVPEKSATEAVRQWIRAKSLWARSGFAKATLEKIRGVYLPAYLYGADAHASYSVEIGEEYQTGTGKNRRTVTEWCSMSGNFATCITDRVVTASRGLPNDELEAVEPFDLRAIRRFTPAMISGWLAEEPSIPRDQCLQMAQTEAREQIASELGNFMPGDSHRSLQYRSQLSNEYIELILLPVWVFTAHYKPDRPPIRIVVNGQSRKVGGKVPYSWVKISLAVLFVIAIIVAAFLVVASRQ